MDEINLKGTANGGSSSSDDEVVVGEDEELVGSTASVDGASISCSNFLDEYTGNYPFNGEDLNTQNEKASASNDLGFFQYVTTDNRFGDRPLPDWVGWQESSDLQVVGSDGNPQNDCGYPNVDLSTPVGPTGSIGNPLSNGEVKVPTGSTNTLVSNDWPLVTDASHRATVPSLFEEDVEFVGVEIEGTERAMEQALKEGIVGEAAPLKRNLALKMPEKEKSNEDGAEIFEFNDANYWRVDQEVAAVQE